MSKDILTVENRLDPNSPTLTRFLMSTLMGKAPCKAGQASSDSKDDDGNELVTLLVTIQSIVKNLSALIRRAGINTLLGAQRGGGSFNVQGEEQQKLDVVANQIFINFLRNSYTCCFLVSEEMDNVVEVETEKQGSYVVCFDPLDGSNNIDCMVSVGSIFAVYRRKTKLGLESPDVEKDVLNPGKELIAAGYALYGSATMMVISVGGEVNAFILDPSIGEFILTKPNIQMKPAFRQYSVNESYSPSWDPRIKAFIEKKKTSGDKPIPQRYIGTFIADFHRTLMYGGIFLYPNNKDQPNGKLRLLYECNPASYIMTKAGGMASSGTLNILDIQPKSIHDRTQIFMGAKEDVEELLACLQ